MEEEKDFFNSSKFNSRGHLTKGFKYKYRYIEKTCPECGYNKAYEDKWRTRNLYTCLERSCRYKWAELKGQKPINYQDEV